MSEALGLCSIRHGVKHGLPSHKYNTQKPTLTSSYYTFSSSSAARLKKATEVFCQICPVLSSLHTNATKEKAMPSLADSMNDHHLFLFVE